MKWRLRSINFLPNWKLERMEVLFYLMSTWQPLHKLARSVGPEADSTLCSQGQQGTAVSHCLSVEGFDHSLWHGARLIGCWTARGKYVKAIVQYLLILLNFPLQTRQVWCSLLWSSLRPINLVVFLKCYDVLCHNLYLIKLFIPMLVQYGPAKCVPVTYKTFLGTDTF